MKHWLLITLWFFSLFLTGCSTVSSRIESNPEVFNRLAPADQALVRQGRIRDGMGPGPVFLAWGKPDSISSGSTLGHPYENWTYLSYTTYPYGAYGAYGGVGYGYYGGPGWFRGDWGYYPFYQANYPVWGYPYRMATFVHGKVIAWSATDWR